MSIWLILMIICVNDMFLANTILGGVGFFFSLFLDFSPQEQGIILARNSAVFPFFLRRYSIVTPSLLHRKSIVSMEERWRTDGLSMDYRWSIRGLSKGI